MGGASFSKCLLVTASVGDLHGLVGLQAESENVDVVVIDEGDERLRLRNESVLKGMHARFFGPKERDEWFIERFGAKGREYSTLVPKRCHAETSFAFLIALEEEPTFVVQLDDDAFPRNPATFLRDHFSMLQAKSSPQVSSLNRWYNTLDLLELDGGPDNLLPRGYPYSVRQGKSSDRWGRITRPSVLHMGHWLGVPDLDALTYIETGFLGNRVPFRAVGILKRRVAVAPATYFSVCSMNASFVPKIIGAFYQFYMNYLDIDRFDDIWSGIIVKRIADHLGDTLTLGSPLVEHRKRPRDFFLDLASEAKGMAINEILWEIIDETPLAGGSYLDCYLEIVEHLERSVKRFEGPYEKFIQMQLKKMRLWSEVCDKLA